MKTPEQLREWRAKQDALKRRREEDAEVAATFERFRAANLPATPRWLEWLARNRLGR